MKTPAFTAIAASVILGLYAPIFGDDLGTELRKSGWDRIIGTWVDTETKGVQHKVTYAWRYKDKVIEIIVPVHGIA